MFHEPDDSPSASLRAWLAERNQYPDRAEAIDAAIRRDFEREAAILVLDMVGFSRISAEQGVISFLAMLEQMAAAAVPAVAGNGGRVVKFVADNLFATFESPAEALEAALDIFRAFEAINAVMPDERDLHGSIGIGFGPTLILQNDLFGVEMNHASKLGEDIAGPDEILLTEPAFRNLPAGRYDCERFAATFGGREHPAYRFGGVLDTRIPASGDSSGLPTP